jgi:hypothetical protein
VTARTAAVALAALTLTAACATAPPAPDIKISDAYVRMPSSPDVTAAYLAVRNNGTAADRLTRVTTADAQEVQIHRMANGGHGMTMRRVSALPIPAHHTTRLTPGGIHLMLIRPRGLHPGHALRLTFTFATSGRITVTAWVSGPGATG